MEDEIIKDSENNTEMILKGTEQNIQIHDFETAKNKIREFAENVPKDIKFRKFSTSEGLFGMFDHRVTGDELNRFLVTLQKYLVNMNQRDDDIVKEFNNIYEAFEYLDKDYIQAILIAVKSAEIASQEAKDAQKDIDVTIDRLHQAIESLSKFKADINSYSHLKDIDQIWENVESLKKTVDGTYSEPQELEMTQQLINQISRNTKRIKLLSIATGCSLAAIIADIIFHLIGVL